MRMWNVNPKIMCSKHLRGEHLEMHMFVGSINKGKSIKGYLDGLVQVDNIISRHDELAHEMSLRGMNHQSPLDDFTYVGHNGHVTEESLDILTDRCPECMKRYIKFHNGEL